MSENFQKISLEEAPRTELHDKLGLTGCEVSVNRLPAGAAAANSGSTAKSWK